MNTELSKQASAKVGNPNVLVNVVSRRVRQLNSGSGPSSRPLITNTAGMGAGDIALTEIVEEKLGWELLDDLAETVVEKSGRKKKS